MGFQPGKPRPKNAGRRKGTPNKATQTLMEKCDAKGIDIFEAMLECCTESNNLLDRFRMYSEIAQYLYPKRRAMEVTGEMNLELSKQVEEIKKLTKEEKIEMLKQEAKRLEEG